MKCSECGHRNRPDDNFCMICAAPLTPTPPSAKRVALPPQDILEGLSDRALYVPATIHSLRWVGWVGGITAVAIVAAIYLLYFVDTYQVKAIDYSPSTYDQTGNSQGDL